ncbi:hypothetical protein EK904_010241, partial [Melospiza melodia maxima]
MALGNRNVIMIFVTEHNSSKQCRVKMYKTALEFNEGLKRFPETKVRGYLYLSMWMKRDDCSSNSCQPLKRLSTNTQNVPTSLGNLGNLQALPDTYSTELTPEASGLAGYFVVTSN